MKKSISLTVISKTPFQTIRGETTLQNLFFKSKKHAMEYLKEKFDIDISYKQMKGTYEKNNFKIYFK